MKMQTGFTLIELMVVVAIIAILSAIAIPQYNDYTARSQLSEAISLLGGLKTPVAEQFANSNAATSCAVPADAVMTGKYVESIKATPAIPCVIVGTMRAVGVNEKVKAATVTITYSASTGIWDCKTSAPAEVAPKACPHG
ncbi:prepilin-type N-terminal cleavage/methylation domain-containing protein [Stenotrophomonas maltophilia]|uniref:pilin n=1 Tax=Stenotrophomonas hibiscicola TaxID=86189 RepID=UPI00131F64D2|nr:pilin [Stenotrophomonas maltophilia]MBA0470848.1 pilin [Stenotrophomonas maltophilia]MBA0477241.1 pilin [Stenotrophomonas maltophilia]MBA0485787.1 pilin [Stenotrophomonas maltophilia]MCU1052200.1 pilin [Stenotrophomonas maltophilia]